VRFSEMYTFLIAALDSVLSGLRTRDPAVPEVRSVGTCRDRTAALGVAGTECTSCRPHVPV
jgi:hypothetical protein